MNTDIKELIGTKFLFNENLISYENLVQLLENKGLNTDFIQKPIKDKLEVHSLYIKPDFEVAFLAKLKEADEYYKDAGYSCINYKEITIQEVLDVLGYKAPEIIENIEHEEKKSKKPKRSKFLTLTNNETEYTIKKNKIVYICYNKNSNKIYFRFKNDCIESFYIPEEKYLEIKEILES